LTTVFLASLFSSQFEADADDVIKEFEADKASLSGIAKTADRIPQRIVFLDFIYINFILGTTQKV